MNTSGTCLAQPLEHKCVYGKELLEWTADEVKCSIHIAGLAGGELHQLLTCRKNQVALFLHPDLPLVEAYRKGIFFNAEV